MRSYDAAVVGAGVFGAWIAYRLRRAGKTVALFDAYGPGNSRSSSGGESRIIRMSYGPDRIYTRWSLRSLTLWKEFLAETGVPGLFQRSGVLWTAPAGDPRVAANAGSLTEAGVAFETLADGEMARRFPQFRFSSPIGAFYEPESGVLLARRCVQAVLREAIRRGVEYRHGAVQAPQAGGRVLTASGEPVSAGEFIYACGPWLGKVFPELLGDRIHVTRQEIFFFGPAPDDQRFAPPAMPAWLDFTDPRGGYSLPDLESRGFKLAFDQRGPPVDADQQERVTGPESIAAARLFLRERFPDLADAPVLETRVCQYENTSNGDFLIDRHPGFEKVWLAGGGSGHGFKHGPAVGEYVEKLLAGQIEAEPRFSLATKTPGRERTVY